MKNTASFTWSLVAGAIVFAAMLAWPTAATAQAVSGQARVVQSTTSGALGPVTTVLTDTGTLGGTNDTRDATLDTGSIPSVLSGEILRAVTISWSDQVASEASIANLDVIVGGTAVSADLVLSRALAAQGAIGSGSSLIGNLAVNGAAVAVTGEPNQAIVIPGGRVVINEQTASPSGTTVNGLHITVANVADLVIASATAGIQ